VLIRREDDAITVLGAVDRVCHRPDSDDVGRCKQGNAIVWTETLARFDLIGDRG
jgi:hypothetical protein